MDSLGDDVRRELRRFGPQAGIGAVVEAWPAAVGPAIARNAWPARIARDGTLHVHTSSSTWAFELAHMERELLERMRAFLGPAMPPRLRFAVGPIPELERAVTETCDATVLSGPTPEQRAEAERLADAISDDELRESVAKAIRISLARAAVDR